MTLATLQPKPSTDPSPAHTMEVCTPKRQDTVTWSLDNPRSVDTAREVFELRVKQGYLAYTVGATGEGDAIREFTPDATRIVLHHPVSGG